MVLDSKGAARRDGGPSVAAILAGCGSTNSERAPRVQLSRRAEIIGRRFGVPAATAGVISDLAFPAAADLGNWEMIGDVIGRVVSKIARSVSNDGLYPERQAEKGELPEALE